MCCIYTCMYICLRTKIGCFSPLSPPAPPARAVSCSSRYLPPCARADPHPGARFSFPPSPLLLPTDPRGGCPTFPRLLSGPGFRGRAENEPPSPFLLTGSVRSIGDGEVPKAGRQNRGNTRAPTASLLPAGPRKSRAQSGPGARREGAFRAGNCRNERQSPDFSRLPAPPRLLAARRGAGGGGRGARGGGRSDRGSFFYCFRGG